MDKKDPKMIVAGGGTGGHLFPGVAVSEEFKRRHEKSEVIFVTGSRKIESEILSSYGFRQVSIMVEGIKGTGLKKKISSLIKLPISLFQSISIIRDFRPDIVFGVGGYSAGPVCLAARLLRVPSGIHEQNSFPGVTNRILSKIVDRVFISFEQSAGHFPEGSLLLSGMPVREAIMSENIPKPDKKRFTILITGGSQGAVAVNDAFIDSLEILRGKGLDTLVIHQTGERDFERVKHIYKEKMFDCEAAPFFENMAEAYGRANIVIGRAGAGTVSELAVLGKPSILIPYPYAANNHQETNALALVNGGGAEMILEKDLSGAGLAALLERYMNDPDSLSKMGERAGRMGKKDAANVIVDELMEMVRKRA